MKKVSGFNRTVTMALVVLLLLLLLPTMVSATAQTTQGLSVTSNNCTIIVEYGNVRETAQNVKSFTIPMGVDVTLTIIPDDGYYLSYFDVEPIGGRIVADETNSLTFEEFYIYTIVHAYVAETGNQVQHALTVQSGEGGTIIGRQGELGDSVNTFTQDGVVYTQQTHWIGDGEDITFDIVPDEGYEVADVRIRGIEDQRNFYSVGAINEYTFKNVQNGSQYFVRATFKESTHPAPAPDRPFADVTDKNSWFYDAVYYNYDNGLMGGTSGTTFSPGATLTREMFVTVLSRLAAQQGEKITGYSHIFTDVPGGDSWYGDAIAWAAAKDIVGGYSDTVFGFGDEISREQMAVLFVRYADIYGITHGTGSSTTFSDQSSISPWATDAVARAAAAGLITGDNGRFNPQDNANRAQAAIMFMRFAESL